MIITIDGCSISFSGRTTIIKLARANGITIPSLCDLPRLEPFAGCRICLVEVKGRKGYVPACSTIAEDGLDVLTTTPEIRELRRGILELILAEHPNACLICAEKSACDEFKSTIRKTGEVTGCVLCPANGSCELQRVVEDIGVDRVHFPSHRRPGDVRRDDPFFDRDNSLCILCGRCVRVCDEVRGATVLTFVARGSQTVVGTAFDRPLLDSGCQFCGACVDVCPTGSLRDRARRYDRPHDARKRTTCPFCGQGCGLMVELREGRILGATPDPTGGPNQGQACVRGRFLIKEAVHHRTRILKPMVRKDGRLGEVSWDEAIATVAERLAGIGPGEVGVAASGHSSCEDLFVLNKFATDVLGARIIAGPWTASVAGILEQLGRATGQDIPLNFRIPDIGRAEVILSFAADLSVTQPIVRLEILRAARSGATVVTPGEHGLTLKSSGVVFFLAALSKILLESGKAPAAGAAGSGPFLASLKAFNLERALSALAISKEKMMEIAQAVKTRKPGMLLLEPGILRLADAAGSLAAAWNLAVLADLRIVPLDGLANIRGGLAIARAFSAQPVTAEDLAAAAASKKIRGLYLAGPFPSASPAAEFVIVQDAYLGETAAVADVVFPETTGLESLGTFVNIEGRIQQADQAIKPRGEAKPGWRLLADLAIKMGATDFGYTSTDSVRHDLIHRVPAFRHLPGTADPSDDLFLQERPATPGAFVDVKTAAGVVEDRLASTPSDPDSYKGLNMARETKSLKLLRGRHV